MIIWGWDRARGSAWIRINPWTDDPPESGSTPGSRISWAPFESRLCLILVLFVSEIGSQFDDNPKTTIFTTILIEVSRFRCYYWKFFCIISHCCWYYCYAYFRRKKIKKNAGGTSFGDAKERST
jgi:hypothetical protein